ncbi:replication licensing factor [Lactarius pseudohatsudake]|nr:replication licensing factor [Lactarius pseudohatsudake]
MTVHLNDNLTRTMSPGDIPFARASLPTPTWKRTIHQLKKQYSEMEVTAEMRAAIERLHDDPTVYQKLAFSIAPEIYVHVDVKKALLLLLVGGVTKTMGDGMRIRGDLNVCLMGDPGVAKSQLLKYISKVAPRGVYTTGKGSSEVGLTAAVMRDPVTDEMVLDNGICYIDEFDKMDESIGRQYTKLWSNRPYLSRKRASPRPSTHARRSYGHYNPKVSPVENINLPAAFLSRFDLLLLLDKPSRDDDERLAQHVTPVHMYNRHLEFEYEPLEPALIAYIALARRCRPVVPPDVSSYIVDSYVRLCKQSKDDVQRDRSYVHASARALLGVLRLAQALARRCCTRTWTRLCD